MKLAINRSRLFGVLLLLILIGVSVRLLCPPYGHISKDLPEGNFTAPELFQEFISDPTNAYFRLYGKVVILEGEVAATGNGYVVIGTEMRVVKCIFRKSIYDRKLTATPGTRVTLKGVCRGMNMTEVLVTNCIILNKSKD
jgi:hypothetical protein